MQSRGDRSTDRAATALRYQPYNIYQGTAVLIVAYTVNLLACCPDTVPSELDVACCIRSEQQYHPYVH
jgi:hypothetical protein